MSQLPQPVQGPILETDYVNTKRRPLDTRSTWPKTLVGGKTFMSLGGSRYSWVSVLDPKSEYDQPLTGVSGTAVHPEIAGTDNPFLHPFGTDFEFYIAPDPPYFELLAPKMTDQSYKDATAFAKSKYGLNVPGVIGMEMDGGLLPTQYRAKEGDRVAVWGRWIVDAGHDDYHTEIHPPLIMATARGAQSAQQLQQNPHDHRTREATIVQIITRPYLVSQEFGDGGLFEHFLKEVAKVLGFASFQVEAHPDLLAVPFQGLNIVTFKVRPPSPRESPGDKLIVEFNMTRRDDSIAMQVIRGTDLDSLRVIIVVNEAGYVPPPKPKEVEYTLTLEELDAVSKEAADAYRLALDITGVVDPEANAVFNRGIKSSKFEKPRAPTLGPVSRVDIRHLRPPPTAVDPSQPFPLAGTLKIEWERDTGPVGPKPTTRRRTG